MKKQDLLALANKGRTEINGFPIDLQMEKSCHIKGKPRYINGMRG